ncbi:MAG: hypothetical protein AAF697_07530 [Pseudomonadota bacterium]
MACTAIGAMALGGGQAKAAVDEYSVDAQSEVTIALELCSAETQLLVRGTTHTDLDFYVRDPDGNQIFSDEGIDDFVSAVVEKDADGCEPYNLRVSNLGEEPNDFTVVVEPISESSLRIYKHIIQPGQSRTVNFKACGTGAEVKARGDGGTDLDFVIRNSDEGVVHENDDLTDETTADLMGLLGDCEVFEMDVVNLGEIFNVLMVTVEPNGVTTPDFAGTAPSTSLAFEGSAGGGSLEDAYTRPAALAEGSGAGTYRAEANASIRVNLPVCGATRLEVRGDGDTDLDFTVSDESGDPIHNDVDLSDVTFADLAPAGECETYDLRVDNLGGVYNEFTIALVDPATRTGTAGPGEYRVNASLATKVDMRICAVTNVRARGDGDTDLDFEVVDSDGLILHENYDTTDVTEFTLDPGDACADYQLNVSNLGTVYNLLTVDFDGAIAGAGGPAPSGLASGNGMGAAPGFAKGIGEEINLGRTITIQNRSGEALSSIFWSNSASFEWGEDMLAGGGSTLAQGSDWDVDVADGSNACLFDFRALTEAGREIRVRAVNVCDLSSVTME